MVGRIVFYADVVVSKGNLWAFNPLPLLGNGSLNKFPRELERRFLGFPCFMKGKKAINSSKNNLLYSHIIDFALAIGAYWYSVFIFVIFVLEML
jgi:hypothetical protein